MTSLRARLFLGMMAVILTTATIGGWLAYAWAYNEAIESQDSVLIQIGAFASRAPMAASQPVKGVDEEAQVNLVELGNAPLGTPDDRRLWSLQDGLHTDMRQGQPIRALLQTRADGSRLALTQRTEIRDEIAQGTALRTLLPIAALVPCLLVVTALVIAHSFKPVVRLAAELDGRRRDDLGQLAISGAPSELHPFLDSINGLLQRLHVMMSQQKRFIADAAHELRTPVTALSVQAENLSPFSMPEEARLRLLALQMGMRRTRHLLEQLLTLARQDATESAENGTTQLDHVTKEVVADLLSDAVSRDIDLGFETVENLSVIGDPTAVTSLVRNLVENAVKFTPDGGRVDISIYREEASAILRIDDTGPGIPPSDLQRVFEPFFRGQNAVKDGSGLGLSIAKRIADRLDGTIQFSNVATEERVGLRVVVRLPLHAN